MPAQLQHSKFLQCALLAPAAITKDAALAQMLVCTVQGLMLEYRHSLEALEDLRKKKFPVTDAAPGSAHSKVMCPGF